MNHSDRGRRRLRVIWLLLFLVGFAYSSLQTSELVLSLADEILLMLALLYLVHRTAVWRVSHLMHTSVGRNGAAGFPRTQTSERKAAGTPRFINLDAARISHQTIITRDALVSDARVRFQRSLIFDLAATLLYFSLALATTGLTGDPSDDIFTYFEFVEVMLLVFLLIAGARWIIYRNQFHPSRAMLGAHVPIGFLGFFRACASPPVQPVVRLMLLLMMIGVGVAHFNDPSGIPIVGGLFITAVILHIASSIYVYMTADSHRPLKLLVLRIFEADENTYFTFRRLIRFWQYFGPFFTIVDPSFLRFRYRLWSGSTGLALLTLIPLVFVFERYQLHGTMLLPIFAGFAAYLSLRVKHRFVADRTSLVRKIDRIVRRPRKLDLTYKSLMAMCFDDTWREAVVELVDRSDVVLVDLRGFTDARAGSTDEVGYLLDTIPVHRVVFLVRTVQDDEAVQALILGYWERLSADSPNLELDLPMVWLYGAGKQDQLDVQVLLDLLIHIAATDGLRLHTPTANDRRPPTPLPLTLIDSERVSGWRPPPHPDRPDHEPLPHDPEPGDPPQVQVPESVPTMLRGAWWYSHGRLLSRIGTTAAVILFASLTLWRGTPASTFFEPTQKHFVTAFGDLVRVNVPISDASLDCIEDKLRSEEYNDNPGSDGPSFENARTLRELSLQPGFEGFLDGFFRYASDSDEGCLTPQEARELESSRIEFTLRVMTSGEPSEVQDYRIFADTVWAAALISGESQACVEESLGNGGYLDGRLDPGSLEDAQFDALDPSSLPPGVRSFVEGFVEAQMRCLSADELQALGLTVVDLAPAEPSESGPPGQPGEASGSALVGDLSDGCQAGSLADCDMLYRVVEKESEEDAIAATCGGSNEPIDLTTTTCMIQHQDFGGEAVELRTQCTDGFNLACDLLYHVAAIGSVDESVGESCGGRSDLGDGSKCAVTFGLGNGVTGPPELAALVGVLSDGCRAGSLADCDMLYGAAPEGSEEETTALTCGGRNEPIDITMTRCMIHHQDFSGAANLRVQCADEFNLACDLLYLVAAAGSVDESVGESCGGRRDAPQEWSWCAETLGAGRGVSGPPELAALVGDLSDGCLAGSLADCDMLYRVVEKESEEDAIAATCGGSNEPIDLTTTTCMIQHQDFGGEAVELRTQCTDGFNLACDLLYLVAAAGSVDESVGESCGGRRDAPQERTDCISEFGPGQR